MGDHERQRFLYRIECRSGMVTVVDSSEGPPADRSVPYPSFRGCS